MGWIDNHPRRLFFINGGYEKPEVSQRPDKLFFAIRM